MLCNKNFTDYKRKYSRSRKVSRHDFIHDIKFDVDLQIYRVNRQQNVFLKNYTLIAIMT
jgi:hypothetical protein